MKDPLPAPYSPTQKSEANAISTLEYLLVKDREKIDKIISDFKSQDKKPDIDGYIVIINKNKMPLCTLEVQVKKIKDRNEDKPRIQCPLSLFGYANGPTLNPVLLIGVDVHNNIAYWKYINKILYEEIQNRISEIQKSVVLTFNKENRIDGENLDYISQWEEIYNDHRFKHDNYELLQKEFKVNAEAYAALKKRSNSLVGDQTQEFSLIHKYLDQLNFLLDTRFQIVKTVFFPDSWKIGFAYEKFSSASSKYLHFPISINANDVQIKLIDENFFDQFKEKRYEVISTIRGNPIFEKPYSQGKKFVFEKIQTIIQYHLLAHGVDEKLSNEYVIAFIDKFKIQLGLEEKDTYSIKEIEEGFFKYLPLWTFEAYRSINAPHLYNKKGFHDPDSYITYIPENERNLIHQQVKKRLLNNDRIPEIRLGNREFPFRIFLQMYTFLKARNWENVTRIYEKKDYLRYRNESSSLFNVYSKKAFEYNISIIFSNIELIYSSLIRRNFPSFKKNSEIFHGANLVIVEYNFLEICPPMGPFTDIRIYFLKSLTAPNTLIIHLLERKIKKDTPDFEGLDKPPFEVKFEGNLYKLIMSYGVTEEIFSDTPCLCLSYKILKNELEDYFKDLEIEEFKIN